VSEDWLTDTEATKIVRRPGDTDEQVSKRMLAAYSSGKVRRRYNAELAAAKMDEVKAEIDAMIAVHRGPLIARHKRPEMSDAEFEAGLREQALETLLLVRFTEFERGSLLQWNGTPAPNSMPVRQAKQADIVMAARAVYDEPKNNNPNKGEAEPLIRQWLSDRGITATRNQIRPVLDHQEFANRRTKIGGPKQR
jgi:hypothetical protein